MCYVMLKYLGILASMKLLGLYNKVWEVGKLPTGWKEAVIISIRKPAGPIKSNDIQAKSSDVPYGKEYNRKISILRGKQRNSVTLWTLLCVWKQIEKAQVNKESVMAVFFST